MDAEIKPPSQENGVKGQDNLPDPDPASKEAVKNMIQKNLPNTRSRSHTPQNTKGPKAEKNEDVKKDKKVEPKILALSLTKIEQIDQKSNEMENKNIEKGSEEVINRDNSKSVDAGVSDISQVEENELKHNGRDEEKCELNVKNGDSVEMDPLILATDEVDPELQFDENSDMESGKGSPVIARCKTRRSLTRNIPTPKTPKSNDSDSEKMSVAPTLTPDPSEVDSEATKPENLNDTNDSIDIEEVSFRAAVGSDVTRTDYMAEHTSIDSEDISYLNATREKSLRETLRGLSSRKTIRPLNDSYRQKVLKNNHNKSGLNVLLTDHDLTDRIGGIKRKSRCDTPDGRKRLKMESSGIVSYLSSPLNNLKNRLKSDVGSSTPKLTSYKDSSLDIHDDIGLELVPYKSLQEKKSWCTIM
ncbi:uncharacterized protein LOC132703006 isoform X2 [Cylas formicarius]|nr:uncharacterized protein LOC132703006 isoform X2 [Cylas formicarius]